MPTSQYLPFCTAGSANTLTPSAWAALTALLADGFQPGIALSEQVNTALRQALTGVAGVAKFAADNGTLDVNDNASHADFASALYSAVLAVVNSQQHWKPGDVKATLSATVPAGWLMANGQLVSRVTYAALFAEFGTYYSAGDGSTTFGLPDLRAVFLRGTDSGRGIDTGRLLRTEQLSMVQAHKHVGGFGEASTSGPFGATTNPGYLGSNASDTDNRLFNTNDGSEYDGAPGNAAGLIGFETRPRNVAVNFLVKT